MVARPPFDLYKKNLLTKNLLLVLFYVFKPIKRDELSKVLYNLQLVKFFEEASELFVIKTFTNHISMEGYFPLSDAGQTTLKIN